MNPVCTCGCETHWESDFDTSDYGIERLGIVGNYHCPNCGAEVTVTSWCETEEECEKRLAKENEDEDVQRSI